MKTLNIDAITETLTYPGYKGIPTYQLETVRSDKAARFPLNSEIGENLLKTFWVKKMFCCGNCYILVNKDHGAAA